MAWSVYGQVDGSYPDAWNGLLWVVPAGEPPGGPAFGHFPWGRAETVVCFFLDFMPSATSCSILSAT